jgi:hypothetical protein
MDPEFCEPVPDTEGDELLLGASTWNPDERSLKYSWRDKIGRRSRGGELPLAAMPQAVLFAARTEYLDRDQIAAIAKGLIDSLAKAEPS